MGAEFVRGLSRVVGAALLTLAALGPAARAEEIEQSEPGAWLGLSARRLSETWRERNEYWASGVLVVRVAPGGPAERAGVGPGDVLVSVGNRFLREPSDLHQVESAAERGRPIPIVIAREGGQVIRMFNVEPDPLARESKETAEDGGGAATVAPEAAREAPPAATAVPATEPPSPKPAAAPAAADRSGADELGLRCQVLDQDLAAALGAADHRGLLVLEVKGGGPAGQAGVRAGDVIFRLGDQAVADIETLDRVVRAAPNRLSITALRRGTPQEMVAALEGRPAPRPSPPPAGAEPAVSGEDWRDRLLLELQSELRDLRREVRELRDALAGRTRTRLYHGM